MRWLLVVCLLLLSLPACGRVDPTTKLNGIWVNETNGSQWLFDVAGKTMSMNGDSARLPFTATRINDTTLRFQLGQNPQTINIRFLNDDTLIWADGQPEAMTMTRRD